MQAHAALLMVRSWWGGSWLGRVALLPIIWVGVVVWKFEGEPAPPVGFHQLRNIVVLIGCPVIAWLIAGLPMYLRAAVWRSAGSTARPAPVARRVARWPALDRPRALPRLSR